MRAGLLGRQGHRCHTKDRYGAKLVANPAWPHVSGRPVMPVECVGVPILMAGQHVRSLSALRITLRDRRRSHSPSTAGNGVRRRIVIDLRVTGS